MSSEGWYALLSIVVHLGKETGGLCPKRSDLSIIYRMKWGYSLDTRTWYRDTLFLYTGNFLNRNERYATRASSRERYIS